jgi:DNA repair exonuclease SbcCD ATPase subunit
MKEDISMNELITRTPQIVAAEINSIKDQTRTMVLCNSIEIGRRLAEAKELVDHGEWGDWLKNSVDFSKSTANNLMRIFEEYGANQIPIFGDNSKSQALGSLSYTQAVALLGVPDKEEFIKENDIENMSTRELQEAIKAQKEAEKRAEQAEKKNKDLLKQSEKTKTESDEKDCLLREAEKKASELQKELEYEKKQTKLDGETSEKIIQLETDLEEAQHQVQELSNKINEPVTLEPVVIEKVPEEIETELNELRQKAKELEEEINKPDNTAILKYGIYFESLVSGFKNLLGALAEIQETDQEQHEKYKKAVIGLMSKMSEKLEV